MVREEFKQNIKKNTDAQEWLDSQYPREKKILERKKENVIRLDVSGENLEGILELEDFASLNKFECSNNQLSRRKFVSCKVK